MYKHLRQVQNLSLRQRRQLDQCFSFQGVRFHGRCFPLHTYHACPLPFVAARVSRPSWLRSCFMNFLLQSLLSAEDKMALEDVAEDAGAVFDLQA